MMQIYLPDKESEISAFAELNLKGTAVALGQFDALHAGHRDIICDVVDYARENGLKSVVYMFENAPSDVVSGGNTLKVNTLEKRFEIIKEFGVDIVIARRFDEVLMNLSCIEFIENYICNMLNAKYITAGYNYRFGNKGEGDAETLAAECNLRGVKVHIVPEVKRNGLSVSSTIIRERISLGDVEGAAQLMGRRFSLKGKVVAGNRIGRELNFPTANMEIPNGMLLPKFGVYETCTRINGKAYPSVTNVGGKPTVDNECFCIETHICAELADIYGEVIEVEFCRFLREIIRFESLELLAKQLRKDKEQVINNKQ
ncbi:MAG: bifunctional riboflavin kinase/FAD synthetase [Clostridia bacterium]|nr:bifunctional riboflavin kinase/FAD synthetase [Clostridia bacterium]